MRRKTEEWLYALLWATEALSRPTFSKLTESFEGWAYRRGLLRRLHALEQEQLVESQPGTVDNRIYRLTELGRLTALRGRDPEACWTRKWDGHWRLVIFDLPENKNSLRVRLRRFLKEHHFGYLQNSVWITPDPLESFVRNLGGYADDVESLILMEARPCGGEPDSAITKGAWDFERINQSYREYVEHLERLSSRTPHSPERLEQWSRQEQTSWFAAMDVDPLLPQVLLPPDYLGRKAWQARRRAVLAFGGLMTKA